MATTTISTTKRTTWRASRAGIALIYMAFAMVVIVALLAFALDVGRVHYVESQLQATADGAARAAARSVVDQTRSGNTVTSTVVTNSAKDIASNNTLDGYIGTNNGNAINVEIGNWSLATRTFTVATTADLLMQANAAHVTVYCSTAKGNAVSRPFAPSIGGTATKDLSAEAIATVFGFDQGSGHGWGVFGKVAVNMNGNNTTDSYDPTRAYGGSNVGKTGGVGSDGSINMNGNPTINGDARWGPVGSPYPTAGPTGGNVTGYTAPLDAMVNYPPVTAPAAGTYNNLAIQSYLDSANPPNLSSHNNVNVPAGTYYINNLDLNSSGASLTITSAPVVFYVKGNILLRGGTNTINNLPANLTFKVMPGTTVDIRGNNSVLAHIYAPDSDITTNGGNQLFGWVIGNTVTMKGTSKVHYDGTGAEDDNPNNGKFVIELVK